MTASAGAAIGIDGELFDRVQFQVERAFQDDDDDDTAWRDVYVDVRINRALQVRGGRFKLPSAWSATPAATRSTSCSGRRHARSHPPETPA